MLYSDGVPEGRLETLERQTLCVSSENPGFALHRGDEHFKHSVGENYNSDESDALEKLALLKKRLLPHIPTEEFWSELMKGMTDIMQAQYALCSKRILPNNESAAVEMPAQGEPGSCLSAVVFYCNNGLSESLEKDFEYATYGGPCAHMKHDKAFLVPARLHEFMIDRQKDFAVPMDSYLGIPIFAEGKCLGHISVFYTKAASPHRKLGWGFIEMTLRALEDIVSQRLVAGQGFVRKQEPTPEPETSRAKIISNPVVVAMQSLKPYARSLSHELRTPMQGVVGMLDIMYATVQEALESPPDDTVAETFRSLRDSIETIQDSSKRAVEAADNVVHAYDFDMEVPDEPALPSDETDEPTVTVDPATHKFTPDGGPASAGIKRRLDYSIVDADDGPSPKHRSVLANQAQATTSHTSVLSSIVHESDRIIRASRPANGTTPDTDLPPLSPSTPGVKITRVRDVVRLVVNESLRFGGRPESAIATETELGEVIDVRTRLSNGEHFDKIVEWAVENSVPEEILVDERDFAKLISVLFLNALKFTQTGMVKLHASLSQKSRYVLVRVIDTGSGIPEAFRPYLFKAFSREDDSLTRQSEGLGLGLMVAKGVARRVGGELICLRSDTEGSQRGSEFELRLPLVPSSDGLSRQSSPSQTPTPLRNRTTTSPGFAEVKAIDLNRPLVATVQPMPVESHGRINSAGSKTPITFAPPLHLKNEARRKSVVKQASTFDRKLAQKYPLNVLVAEDNRINRKLLVSMLGKLGYAGVQEAFDGSEAVRLMEMDSNKAFDKRVDVILMDLWMPNMDGYEAAQRIQELHRAHSKQGKSTRGVKILAVSADVTDDALLKAREVGMDGFMTKPYKLLDLERLIVEHCRITS